MKKSKFLLLILLTLLNCEKKEFKNPYDPVNFPERTELLEPEKGDTVLYNPPFYLECKKVKNAERYRFLLARDSLFKDIILDYTSDFNVLSFYSEDFFPLLLKDKKIYWKVQTLNRVNRGYFSQPSYFYIKPFLTYQTFIELYNMHTYRDYLIAIKYNKLISYNINDSLIPVDSLSGPYYSYYTHFQDNRLIYTIPYYGDIQIKIIEIDDYGKLSILFDELISPIGYPKKAISQGDILFLFMNYYDTTKLFIRKISTNEPLDSFSINILFEYFAVKGNHIFMGKDKKIYIYEYKKDTLKKVNEISFYEKIEKMKKTEDYLFILSGNIFKIFNVQDPSNPILTLQIEADNLITEYAEKSNFFPPDIITFYADTLNLTYIYILKNGNLSGAVKGVFYNEEYAINHKYIITSSPYYGTSVFKIRY